MNKVFEATDDLNELIGKYSYGIVKAAFSKIESKENEELEKAAFNGSCYAYGLKPEHYGATFMIGTNRYSIRGVKPSNRKYPILANRVSDHKGFKFTIEQVKMALGI